MMLFDFKATITKRTRGSFERLLGSKLMCCPPAEMASKLDLIDEHRKLHQQKASPKTPSTSTASEASPLYNQIPEIVELTGKRVRELRIAQGLSVTKLAFLAGMAKSMVSMIETGKRSITPETRKRLLQALRLS